MSSKQITVILKSFEAPDDARVMQKGRFEIVHVGGMTIGRATYEPGWKWSEHVGPGVGATRCNVEHVGLVLSGCATAAFDDGRWSRYALASSFTFRQFHTTAGSSAMSRTFHYTFLAQKSTRRKVNSSADYADNFCQNSAALNP
jgi:hypothetical protein